MYRDSSVHTVVLDGSSWVVGRADDCDVRLADPTVSRRQLLLERECDTLRFRDLGGTNVTLLEGRPVRQGSLAVGDTLVVGMTRLTLDRLHRGPSLQLVADDHTPFPNQRPFELVADEDDSGDERRALAAFLERLAPSIGEHDTLESAGTTLLELTLAETGAEAALLIRLEGDAQFTVLASSQRTGDAHTEVIVPEAALRDLRATPLLFGADGESSAPRQLLVPLGRDPDGVAILQTGSSASAFDATNARLAVAIAQLIWNLVNETARSCALRELVDRLRFATTDASASLQASARLTPVVDRMGTLLARHGWVLLIGEDGTEREPLVRFVHARSQVASGPLVVISADTIPREELERDLFGDDSNAALIRAHGGTLLIDRVDELSDRQQIRLARVLTERVAHGSSTGDGVRLDVRLVATATPPGADELETELAEAFHDAHVEVPPLRGHGEDIEALTEVFLEELGPSADGSGRSITSKAQRALLDYTWPGNTRQLRRTIENAAARAGNKPISQRHLPTELLDPTNSAALELPTLEEVELHHIRRVLAAVGGSRRRAARILGISPSTIYEKVRRYKLD